MPRPLWTGSLSFGLVNVPVSVVPAVRDLDLHFHQLHAKDAAPIEVQRWCSKEDVEVSWPEITHGYELQNGGEVMVSDLELQAVQPRRTRTIEIEQFIELDDADPIYFDHPYFLVPASDDEGPMRAYELLSQVMSRTHRAAVGRFVMRAKEYLAIVRPRDGALALTTMTFADEVRPTTDIDGATQSSHVPTDDQLSAAVAVVQELTSEWDPAKYKDRYRARLRKVVDRKRRGATVPAPSPPPAAPPAPDLMDALERTLEQIKQGQDGRSSARGRQ